MIKTEIVSYQQWEFITAYPLKENLTLEETMSALKVLGLEGWQICGAVGTDKGIVVFLQRPLKENVPIKVMYADPSDTMAA